jgi:hypothetical protein
LGFRVEGLGFRIEGVGFRIEGVGFRIEGLGFRVGDLEILNYGLQVSGVQGLGTRNQKSGFRI